MWGLWGSGAPQIKMQKIVSIEYLKFKLEKLYLFCKDVNRMHLKEHLEFRSSQKLALKNSLYFPKCYQNLYQSENFGLKNYFRKI